MNIKTNVVKLAVGASVVSAALAAYAFVPGNQPSEQINIASPFHLTEINPRQEQAVFITDNQYYTVEVSFDAEYFKDGNGAGQSWTDVEVKEIKDIHVYNEDGEVLNAYVDRLDVQEIVQVIEQELRKP